MSIGPHPPAPQVPPPPHGSLTATLAGTPPENLDPDGLDQVAGMRALGRARRTAAAAEDEQGHPDNQARGGALSRRVLRCTRVLHAAIVAPDRPDGKGSALATMISTFFRGAHRAPMDGASRRNDFYGTARPVNYRTNIDWRILTGRSTRYRFVAAVRE